MPAWHWTNDPGARFTVFYSDDAPGWRIDGNTHSSYLMHGNNVIGKGECKDLSAKAFEDVPQAPAPRVPAPVEASNPSPTNVLSLVVTNGAMFASVALGGHPVIMQVDTGANTSTVEEAIAQQLVSSGEATQEADGQSKLADGITTTHNITIGTVTIAGRQAHNVRAGVVPDGAGMLLGLILINQISPTFTVDLTKNRIVLGS